MDFYELVLFVHLFAVIAWLGAGFAFQMLAARIRHTGDVAGTRKVLTDAASLGTVLFAPASVLALVAGVVLVIDGPWGFGDLWVLIGLAGFLVSGAMSSQYDKLARAAGDGPADAATEAVVARFVAIARADLVILFAVVADMALKPTTDDVGLLVVMALLVVGGVAFFLRGAPAVPPAAAQPATGS